MTTCVAIMLLGCAVLLSRPAAAADLADWPALASNVFHTVGEDTITSTTSIVEDSDGFLWAGGQSGLSRWDGYRLKTYVPNPQVAGSLPDAFINILLADRRGRLWVGTTSGGLARYAPDTDRFITYAAGRAGPSSSTILALADARDGLWIGTSRGLDFRVDRTGEFRHYRHNPRDARSIPDGVVSALLIDGRGALWAATEGGLVRAEPGTTTFDPIRLPAGGREKPAPLSLFEDSQHRVWVGTMRHGLFVIARDGRTARAVHGSGARRPRMLLDGSIQTISEPRPGTLWLGTYAHGILSLDVASGSLGWIHNEPNLPTSLPQNTVGSIYRDRAGAVWVGTLSGLSRYDAEQRTFATVFVASSALGGISSPDVTAIYAPPAGPVWVGYGSDGIDRIDPVRGRVGMIRSDGATPQTALPDSATRSIAGLPGGPVFVASQRGLYRMNEAGRDVRLVPLRHGRNGDDVDALRIVNGRLWIGTSADGLWSMDMRATSVPVHVRTQPLTDNRILSIEPAAGARLWIGTYHGLNLVDPRSGEVEQIVADATNANRLANNFISAILVDRGGHVWVGTFGGGLAIMQGRDRAGRPRFERIGTAQGLPNANVDSLATDRLGHVWVATDNGLAVVDAVTHAVRRLDRSDGVELPSYYVGSRVNLPNGDIAFGANRGITIVHPDRLRALTYRPPLVVTEARTGGRSVVAVNRFNGHDGHASIVVRPDANSLAVEFAALDYTAAERIRYAYRLRGFDTDWIDTDASRRLAAYTNLPPGDYVLELRASNRDGAWSAARVAIPVHVVPAWHQTLAVHLAEFVLAVLFVAALMQMRTAVTRRHERELENQVIQRTAELRQREHQLHLMAYRDALTDLPNRRMFNDEYRRMLAAARRQREEVALLLIDLDRFKHVNDTLGHDAGDALLVEAASRLAGLVRESDSIARLGGDEFAILLGAGRDAAAIEAVCERITAAFVEPVRFGDATLKTTPSIGIAVYPQHGTTPDQLYKSADLALYAAKLAGRNTWRRATLEPA